MRVAVGMRFCGWGDGGDGLAGTPIVTLTRVIGRVLLMAPLSLCDLRCAIHASRL
jgi:hypothetical protein